MSLPVSRKVALLLTLIPALTIVACGEDSQKTSRPPVSAERTVPQPQAQPVPPAHPVTAKTRETYQWYCSQCHGTGGKGNGINAMLLTVPPRDHTKADYLETRSDAQLFQAIQSGGLSVGRAPCMPAWGHTLDDGTIHSLVSYIRELCRCQAL